MLNKSPQQPHPERAREEAIEDLYRRFTKRGVRRQRRRRLLVIMIAIVAQMLSGAKRALDILTAIVLILIFAPLLVLAYLTGSRPFLRTPKVGRWGEIFDQYSFPATENFIGRSMARLRGNALPILFNILKGDISFVGPRLVAVGDLNLRDRAVRRRFDVRPGMISPWWIRRRANIAFDSEVTTDEEYVATQSVWGDLGIALRAIPAAVYGEGVNAVADIVSILNIRIHNLTMSEALDSIIDHLRGDRPIQVCFVNADCANISYKDTEYLTILNRAELTLADGIGLKLAGKLLGREIKQNINGTDLFPRLCAALSDTGQGIFLLGAKPGVTEKVRDWIQQMYPEVTVSGFHHGYFSPAEEPEVIRQIADSGASLLFVAFGAPRQDKWINKHLEQTGVKVAIGVGGLFDFFSGNVSRAPQWMREIGMEWFYRFMQEPGRMWKRYFVGNGLFLFRVFKERNRQSLLPD